MRPRHLLQRTTHVLHGQILQRDPPDHRQQRPQQGSSTENQKLEQAV